MGLEFLVLMVTGAGSPVCESLSGQEAFLAHLLQTGAVFSHF